MVFSVLFISLMRRFFGFINVLGMYRLVFVPSGSAGKVISEESRIANTKFSCNHFISSKTNHYERIDCIMGCSTWCDSHICKLNLGSFLFQRVLQSGGDSRFEKLKKKVEYLLFIGLTSSLLRFFFFGLDKPLGYHSSLYRYSH